MPDTADTNCTYAMCCLAVPPDGVSMEIPCLQVGQALSSRPDLLPPVYLRELGELQDQLPPFPTPIAMDVIREELGREAGP